MSIKTIFGIYKWNCYVGNKYWGLTMEEFAELIVQPCFYCGSTKKNSCKGFPYMGIDRKNNRKGYHRLNVVPCCKRCNSIKGEHLSFEEMLSVGKTLKRFVKR